MHICRGNSSSATGIADIAAQLPQYALHWNWQFRSGLAIFHIKSVIMTLNRLIVQYGEP